MFQIKGLEARIGCKHCFLGIPGSSLPRGPRLPASRSTHSLPFLAITPVWRRNTVAWNLAAGLENHAVAMQHGCRAERKPTMGLSTLASATEARAFLVSQPLFELLKRTRADGPNRVHDPSKLHCPLWRPQRLLKSTTLKDQPGHCKRAEDDDDRQEGQEQGLL